MTYDEELAQRVRQVLEGRKDVEERRMFGGLVFMVAGRMCVGVERDEIVVRLGAEEAERALARPHVRPMDFTGRPLRGFVYVARPGFRTVTQLREWVRLGVAHAEATSYDKRAPGSRTPSKRRPR